MEWLESIRKSIDYMEQHLLEVKGAEAIANEVYMSSFYLQKGFKFMTGYTMAEYIRNRRLYLAALDVIAGKDKVIDIAYKYGYDTPESFTKAFSRFHGYTPMQIRNDARKIKVFLPLKISIRIQGGNDMDYVVEKMNGFKVIGFERSFSFDSSYLEIPKFWDETFGKYIVPMFAKEKPEGSLEETISNCGIGEFGICIDDASETGKFRYLIAGVYKEGTVPEGMTVYEIPETEWAKFKCKGPLPGALQAVNTKIFKEWLPGNPEYEMSLGINIEWYSIEGKTTDADYESAIWIPVKRK
jgi:AraC family transcriptional regulator